MSGGLLPDPQNGAPQGYEGCGCPGGECRCGGVCGNGPDEHGDYPCDPAPNGDGTATCTVCGWSGPVSGGLDTPTRGVRSKPPETISERLIRWANARDRRLAQGGHAGVTGTRLLREAAAEIERLAAVGVGAAGNQPEHEPEGDDL